MQRIDRYGLVTLVFLIVTFLAVIVWGEGGSASFDEHFRKSGAGVAGPLDEGPRTLLSKEPARSVAAKGQTPARKQPRASSQAASRSSSKPAAHSASQASRSTAQTALPLASAKGNQRTARPSKEAAVSPDYRTVAQVEPRSKPAPISAQKPTESKPIRGQSRATEYIVKPGDTLSEIALAQLGTSKRWREIVEVNPGLDPNKIKVGARLRLPAGAQGTTLGGAPLAAASRSQTSKPKGSSARGTYVVKPGDTLSGIAQRELGSAKRWKEIVPLNPGLNPDRVLVGKRLKLPVSQVSQVAPASSPTERPVRVASASPRSGSRVQ